MNKNKKPQTLTFEARKLLERAKALPGAATLMEFYLGLEKVQTEYLKYSRSIAPLVNAQTASSAVPQPQSIEDHT